jgi:hypothetical protein
MQKEAAHALAAVKRKNTLERWQQRRADDYSVVSLAWRAYRGAGFRGLPTWRRRARTGPVS